MLRFLSLDKSGGPNDEQTDIAIHNAMPLAWLNITRKSKRLMISIPTLEAVVVENVGVRVLSYSFTPHCSATCSTNTPTHCKRDTVKVKMAVVIIIFPTDKASGR